jgi:hypothetical protein
MALNSERIKKIPMIGPECNSAPENSDSYTSAQNQPGVLMFGRPAKKQHKREILLEIMALYEIWLGGLDSNQDNQIQNLMYCRLYDLPAEGDKKSAVLQAP